MRETRLVCLPCQPSPARCASGFSITGAVSTNTFTSGAEARDDELRQVLQPALDHVVVVAVARIDRDAAAIGLRQRGQRIVVGRVGQAEHDHAARLRPERARMAALLGACRRASPCRRAGRRRGSRASRSRASGPSSARQKPTASKPSASAVAIAGSRHRGRRRLPAQSPSAAPAIRRARPGRESTRPRAARRSARTRRSACRRADTNSRRCAATPGPAAPSAARRSASCRPRGRRRGCGTTRETASATCSRRSSRAGCSR